MSNQPEKPADEKAEGALDRCGVLREFVRTGKYAAPIATVLLFGAEGRRSNDALKPGRLNHYIAHPSLA